MAPWKSFQKRDPKKHYKKAAEGKINDFTGVNTPYEAPTNPDLTIETEHTSVDAIINNLLSKIIPLCFQND